MPHFTDSYATAAGLQREAEVAYDIARDYGAHSGAVFWQERAALLSRAERAVRWVDGTAKAERFYHGDPSAMGEEA